MWRPLPKDPNSSLVGTQFLKKFEQFDNTEFRATITRITRPGVLPREGISVGGGQRGQRARARARDACTIRVLYDDGDAEEITLNELERHGVSISDATRRSLDLSRLWARTAQLDDDAAAASAAAPPLGATFPSGSGSGSGSYSAAAAGAASPFAASKGAAGGGAGDANQTTGKKRSRSRKSPAPSDRRPGQSGAATSATGSPGAAAGGLPLGALALADPHHHPACPWLGEVVEIWTFLCNFPEIVGLPQSPGSPGGGNGGGADGPRTPTVSFSRLIRALYQQTNDGSSDGNGNGNGSGSGGGGGSHTRGSGAGAGMSSIAVDPLIVGIHICLMRFLMDESAAAVAVTRRGLEAAVATCKGRAVEKHLLAGQNYNTGAKKTKAKVRRRGKERKGREGGGRVCVCVWGCALCMLVFASYTFHV